MSSAGGGSGMWTGLKSGHVSLVAGFGAKFALRTGGGIVFLLILLLTGLFVAQVFVWPVETFLRSDALKQAAPDKSPSEIVHDVAKIEGLRAFVSGVVGSDDAQADYLLSANPALLSAILVTLLGLLPFVICLGGFNQTSGDIQNRGMRYLLLRTERANIFFGRFAGVVVFSGIYLAFVLAIVVFYIGMKLKLYDAGALFSWAAQGYLALLFISLPYLALCSWISAAIDSPFGALVICLMLVGLPLLFLLALANALHADYDFLIRFLPWGWKYDLLHGEIGKRLTAMGVLLGFTGLFVMLGLRTFHRRDL